jgi:hypothetical protein
MSTNGHISSHSAAQDIAEARARLAAEVKLDILTGTYEEDNELARKEVSRSFVCESTLTVDECCIIAHSS